MLPLQKYAIVSKSLSEYTKNVQTPDSLAKKERTRQATQSVEKRERSSLNRKRQKITFDSVIIHQSESAPNALNQIFNSLQLTPCNEFKGLTYCRQASEHMIFRRYSEAQAAAYEGLALNDPPLSQETRARLYVALAAAQRGLGRHILALTSTQAGLDLQNPLPSNETYALLYAGFAAAQHSLGRHAAAQTAAQKGLAIVNPPPSDQTTALLKAGLVAATRSLSEQAATRLRLRNDNPAPWIG